MKPMIDVYHASEKDCYIEVVNQGTFDAYFTVDYSHDNTDFTFKSKVLNSGMLDKIMLCGGGINIHVVVYVIASTGELTIYDKTFATTTTLKLLLSGTELAPVYTDVTKLPSPNDKTEFYTYYVSVINTVKYIAKLTVKYTISNKNFTIEKDKIITKHTQIISLPTMAQNIQVSISIKEKSSTWKSIYSNTLTTPSILKLSLSGTLANPIVSNISSELSIGNLPSLSQESIAVVNKGDFTAQFMLTYNLPDTINSTTTMDFSKGESKSIILPSEAADIDFSINILASDNSWLSIYQDFFTSPTSLKFELTGTLSDPIVTDITNNIPETEGPDPVNPPVMKLIKHPDKPMATLAHEVIYTLKLSNTAGSKAEYVKIKDIIPAEASFVANSLTINGNIITKTSFPETAIDLGDMNSGDSHTITYKIKFNSVPNPNVVKVNSTVTYDYTDTDGSLKEISLASETVPLMVSQNCCCCPCMNPNCQQDTSYTDYFDYI